MEKPVDKSKKKGKTSKIDFKKRKANTMKSLVEVEMFLGDLKKACNVINVYNIFKGKK